VPGVETAEDTDWGDREALSKKGPCTWENKNPEDNVPLFRRTTMQTVGKAPERRAVKEGRDLGLNGKIGKLRQVFNAPLLLLRGDQSGRGRQSIVGYKAVENYRGHLRSLWLALCEIIKY